MQKELLKIINTIRNNKGDKEIQSIKLKDDLRDDIGFDSFDLAELTVRCEAEFGVDIFEDSIVSTVEEVLAKLNG